MSGASLISVIVTTYNREDALDAVIRALGAQSDQNFEIIIANDGSGPDTTSLIESWKPRLALPLKHVRHVTVVYRKPAVINGVGFFHKTKLTPRRSPVNRRACD